MSVVSTDALYERLREVLEAGAGSLRTITADTFRGGLPEELSDRATAVKALARPRCEAFITKWALSSNTPPRFSSLAIYLFELRVRVVRLLPLVAQLEDADRDAVKALAASDTDLLAQALGRPGNLLTTAGGTPTGVVSGLVSYVSSTATVRLMAADSLSVIETDHLFSGLVTSNPATS